MSRLVKRVFAAEWRQSLRRYRFLVFGLMALDVIAAGGWALFTLKGASLGAAGPALFGMLAGTLFSFLGMIGPAMGSAAIAEERRNFSASLLLLTDLSRWDIIVGKFASRAALTLLIVVLCTPLLVLSGNIAAISWPTMLRLLVIAAIAAVNGVAVGVFVAMLVRRSAQATILSYFGLLLLFVILPSAAQLILLQTKSSAATLLLLDAWSPLFAFQHELAGLWQGAEWRQCILLVAGGLMLMVVLITLSGLRWSAERVRRWDAAELGTEENSEGRKPKAERRLTGFAKSARFTPAVACAFFLVMFLGIVVMQRPHMTWQELAQGMSSVYFPTCWFLVNVALVLYGARAFAEEKETGTLELLATTPLSNAALVWNKMAALLRTVGSVPATLAGCQLALWIAGGEANIAEVPKVQMLAGTPIAVATRLVHFYLVMIGALWLSAWCRNMTRASLGALVAFLSLTWACVLVSETLLALPALRSALTGPGGAVLGAALAFAGLLLRLAAAAGLHVTLNKRLRTFAAEHR